MAKNESVVVSGKSRWAFTRKFDQFDEWSIVLYPNPESLDTINGLIKDGIKNQLKKDDDGYYIKFKRQPEKKKKDGTVFRLDPPEILLADGTPFNDIIGDGSDVTIRLEVYGGKAPFGGGNYLAARLGGVKVQNLVPYLPATMAQDPWEQKYAQKLMDAPLQKPTW